MRRLFSVDHLIVKLQPTKADLMQMRSLIELLVGCWFIMNNKGLCFLCLSLVRASFFISRWSDCKLHLRMIQPISKYRDTIGKESTVITKPVHLRTLFILRL